MHDEESGEEVEVIVIEDKDVFLKALRDSINQAVAQGTIAPEDLDQYLPLEQMYAIVQDYIENDPEDEDDPPFMLEEAYPLMVSDVASAFLGACLSKLAAAGLVETAWDDEKQSVIFWKADRRTDD